MEPRPPAGVITIEWFVGSGAVEGRLGWSFKASPQVDPRLAIALLRDVAAELEEDLDSN